MGEWKHIGMLLPPRLWQKHGTQFVVLTMAAVARGQAGPGAAATAPVTRNLDRALSAVMAEINAQNVPLGEFVDFLRKTTMTNIAVNWNALAAAGITRDVPVSLRLKGLTFEAVVRALMEVLQAKGAGGSIRLNFVVADNVLEITTDAEIGKGTEIRLYDVGRAASYAYDKEKLTDQEVESNADLIEKLVRVQLVRAGEPMESAGGPAGHSVVRKGLTISASVSERGQRIVDRATGMLATPLRPGVVPPGTALTAAAKKVTDDFRKAMEGSGAKGPAEAALMVAKKPEEYAGKFNFVILPGTEEELAKEAPASSQISAVASDWGVMLIGPREAIESRTFLGVYDLRDVMRRIANRAALRAPRGTPAVPAADAQAGIVSALQQKVVPEGGWGDEGDLEGRTKKWSVMVPLHGVLIVVAPADIHRAVGSALQEMNK